MTEEWRSVIGYAGIYSVSNLGRVRRDLAGQGSRAGYILRQSIIKANGYLRVALVVNGKQVTRTVHSLVAEAFLGPSHGLSVNHIDGVKIHNESLNLEYLSLAENNHHGHAIGLYPPLVSACIYGHVYDQENTVERKDGRRDCRVCKRKRNRDYKARQFGVRRT